MAKSKLVQANEKIAESVVDGYKKIENGCGKTATRKLRQAWWRASPR